MTLSSYSRLGFGRTWLTFLENPWILLTVILVLGAVLRFYRLADLVLFQPDQGRNAIVVRDMIEGDHLTLLGPTSSIGTYHRGPAYYYMLLLPFVVGHENPVSGAMFDGLVDLGTILLLYIVGRTFFNAWVGLAAAALWSCGSLTVLVARLFWEPFLLPFFVLLMLYALRRIADGKDRYLLLLVPSWCIAWQLHDEALFLLPLFGAFAIWFRPRVSIRKCVAAAALGVLTLAPFLVYEFQNGFANSSAMLQYLLDSKASSRPEGIALLGAQRLGRLFAGLDQLIPGNGLLHGVLRVVALTGIAGAALATQRPKQTSARLFLLFLLVPLLYAFWPGKFDSHYFAILFPIPFLLIGLGLGVSRRRSRFVTAFFSLGLVGIVLSSSITWIQTLATRSPGPGTYLVTKAVVDRIIADASGKPFAFTLVSSFEGFEAYDSPYRYLFAVRQREPSERVDVDRFTVYDPEGVRDGATQPGTVINGVKVVHSPPLTNLGDSLLPSPGAEGSNENPQRWELQPGATVGAAGQSFVLMPSGPMVNVTFTTLKLTPGNKYAVSFEFRNSSFHGEQRVYVTVDDAGGKTLGIFPNGGGYVCLLSSTWTTGSFAFIAPSQTNRATIWLRATGKGEADFETVELRAVR